MRQQERGGKSLFIGAAVTILTALLRLAIEITQLCRHPQEYLQDWVNWLEIPLYLFSIMFTFVFATPCLCVYSWQWQIGVVAVFLGWIGLITFLQKWPVTGVYILMFINIIVSFLKIAFLALLLVIAFALGFYMLLYEPDEMVSTLCIFKLSNYVSVIVTLTLLTVDINTAVYEFGVECIFKEFGPLTRHGLSQFITVDMA